MSGVEGAEQNLVVVSDIVQVWPVPITEPGQEMKIVLPEAATLVVRYDIPGDTEPNSNSAFLARLCLLLWSDP